MVSVSGAGAFVFALFVFAGYYKAADVLSFFPFDLTLLFWIASLGLCAFAVWRQRRFPPGAWPLLAVFLAMGLGLHWPVDLTAYPEQKELRLYSLTALSAFAPLLLLRETDSRRIFMLTVAGLGLVMALVVTMEVLQFGFNKRLAVFNTNPILLARASGFAAVVICLYYWLKRIDTWLAAPLLAIALLGLLVAGSRGPLVAFVLTTVLAIPFCVPLAPIKARIWGSLAFSFGGFAVVVAYLVGERAYVARRLLRLLSGDWSFTEWSRLSMWRDTAALIADSPLGIGWGRLTEWIQVYSAENLLHHPHNIFLEIAVEAGWLAAAAFVALLVLALAAILPRPAAAGEEESPRRDEDRLLVSVACGYWLICALFSGDVNDNRPLWAMLGMALATAGARQAWKRILWRPA